MPILHWLTREQDLHASGRAPFRLLEHVETYGEAGSPNMLIQGDNLDALKALLPYYAGKVKCIYIEKGTVLKRFTARAKGRGNRILKPTCHIFVTVGN